MIKCLGGQEDLLDCIALIMVLQAADTDAVNAASEASSSSSSRVSSRGAVELLPSTSAAQGVERSGDLLVEVQ